MSDTPVPASNSSDASAEPAEALAPERRVRQTDEASRGTVAWLMGLIIVWGVIAAAGIARYDYLHDQLNLTKPLIVIVCTLVVVGGWMLALRRRGARS